MVGDDPPSEMREADLANGEPDCHRAIRSRRPTTAAAREVQPAGTDTPTGTDPAATYDQPGYEDKSLGQAVAQDRELVDHLLEETGGDEGEAERRFDDESAGRTTLERQRRDAPDDGESADEGSRRV